MERAPLVELPRRTRAHRAVRQLGMNGDAVAALRAVVSARRLSARDDELDVVTTCGVALTRVVEHLAPFHNRGP